MTQKFVGLCIHGPANGEMREASTQHLFEPYPVNTPARYTPGCMDDATMNVRVHHYEYDCIKVRETEFGFWRAPDKNINNIILSLMAAFMAFHGKGEK